MPHKHKRRRAGTPRFPGFCELGRHVHIWHLIQAYLGDANHVRDQQLTCRGWRQPGGSLTSIISLLQGKRNGEQLTLQMSMHILSRAHDEGAPMTSMPSLLVHAMGPRREWSGHWGLALHMLKLGVPWTLAASEAAAATGHPKYIKRAAQMGLPVQGAGKQRGGDIIPLLA